jgi:eukaryotic-like serine/threonine-protein kinase
MDPSVGNTLIGTSVGNYQVISELGAGAMGEVYLGEHPQIGRKVAIKVLVQSLANNQSMADRFMSEARAVNKINHPNIIQIFDFGQLPDGRLYYTMEYLQGRELKHVLKEHAPLSLQSTADVLRQISGALQAAHSMGVVHRDLKPENIFVVETENSFTVKILDFGIAKLLEPGIGESNRTSTGMIMGTPLYMSPEQAAGDVNKISAQSDIYALGVIAYQMLSGHLPIDAPTTAQILAMHITEAPTPLATVAQGIPPDVATVVEGSLAKEPELRPRTSQEFYETFARACAGASPGMVAIPLTLPGKSMVGSSSSAGISSAGQSPTTLGNSAAEVVSLSGAEEYASGWSGGKIAAVVVVLILAVGGVGAAAWYMSQKKDTGPKSDRQAQASAMAPVMQEAPMVPEPVMRPVVVPKPDPLKVFMIGVRSKTRRIRVEITLGNQKPYKKRIPFKLEVKGGERVTLRATRRGYEEQVESFLVTADKKVVFSLERLRAGYRRPRPRPMVITARARPRPRPRYRPRPRRVTGVGEGTLKPMF